MIYLLDTDACIDVLRRRDPVARTVARRSPGDLAVATMTEAELEYGVLRHPSPLGARARLDHFLSGPIEILPFGREAARAHARLRVGLRSQPIGPHDLIIASIAVAHGLVLVTHNTREFARVADLKVEDWSRGGG